jgi:hypothetical protein
MTEDEKKQHEQDDGVQIVFPGGSVKLTGDTVKQLAPYIGKCLLIGTVAYFVTVIAGLFK